MMKRFIALIVSLMLTLSLPLSMAEGTQREENRTEETQTEENRTEGTQTEENRADAGQENLLTTEDKVTIGEDGTISIGIGEITVTVPPAADWYLLTQDIWAQLYEYMDFSNDPMWLANTLISNGYHLYGWKKDAGLRASLRVGSNKYSGLFENLDLLDERQISAIIRAEKKTYPDLQVSSRRIGEHVYIVTDARKEEVGSVFYEYYLRSAVLQFELFNGSEKLTEEGLEQFERVLATITYQ